MKTANFKTALLFAAIIIFTSVNAAAQPGNGRGNGQGQGFFCQNIPNLTAEQQQKIEGLRTAHLKEMTNFRNQMGEKRAKLNTLQTADKPDMNAINSLIDEMGSLRTNMQKKNASHRQDIRNILTPEQRVYFDAKPGKGQGNGNGNGYGCGQGRGYGYGNGFGRACGPRS